MNKENVLAIIIALLIGLVGGYLVFSIGKKPAMVPGGGLPAGGGAPVDTQKRIEEAKKIIAQDPKNLKAWVMLGNDYFDTNQPQQAIAAYQKALELDPSNANILTDQGLMYRQIGWYDKAQANYEKAQKIDPKHEQSLLNLGVLYLENLKQPAKAIQVFSRYLELFPTSPNAQRVKATLDEHKANPPGINKK